MSALFNAGEITPSDGFLRYKDNGGLIKPSNDVIQLCTVSEKMLRILLVENGGKPPKGSECLKLRSKIIEKFVGSDIFNKLHEHSLENALPENHIVMLARSVVKLFMKIRLNHIASRHNHNLQKTFLRQHLNKCVLFQNQ